LVNLHLQSFNFRLPKSDHSYLTPSHVMSKQGLQAEMILNKVSIHNPMLIAGDFNATPGMTAYELFAEQHRIFCVKLVTVGVQASIGCPFVLIISFLVMG